jgi:hypothetical protein
VGPALHESVPPPVSAIARRTTRRRARIGAACAAGLAVAVVTAVLLLLGGLSGPGEPGNPMPLDGGHGRYPSPPGHPFLMTLAPDGGRAVVRNAATGATVASLRPASPRGTFTWVAAAPDDRMFVLGEEIGSTGTTRFEALRLGRIPTVLAGLGVSTTGQIYGMAVSPDDSAVAVATTPRSGLARGRIQVFGIGHQRPPLEWTSPVGAAGELSWTSSGTLAFDWQDTHRDSRSGLRILHVPGSGSGTRSLLGASRLAVPEPQYAGTPQLTADGATVLWDVAAGKANWLDEFSATTGRLLRRYPMAGRRAGQSMTYCGVLWASRTGDSVITQCGRDQEWIRGGRVHKVRLVMTIPASMVGERNTFAW